MNEDQFLLEIMSRPDGIDTRLVYADWLEEHNDPRFEFVRVNCELSPLPMDLANEKYRHLINRELELMGKIEDRQWIKLVAIPRIHYRERRIQTSRSLPGPGTAECADLFNPGGSLEIARDGFGRGLKFNDDPIALIWDDCSGSVGQMLLHSGRTVNFSNELEQIRNVAAGQFDSTRRPADQIQSLLMTFKSGIYLVGDPQEYNFYPYYSDISGEGTQNFYPSSAASSTAPVTYDVVCSQSRLNLKEERIAFWQTHLDDKPIVFAIADPEDWVLFVIDGHHKLEAYFREQRPAAFIVIEKLVFDTTENFEHFFGHDQSGELRDYRRLRSRIQK